MRYIILIFLACVVTVMVVAGKRGSLSRRPPIEIFPDMNRQPKLRPQTPNEFFGDAKSSRPPIAGTVARGDRYEDSPANTGRITGTTNFVVTIPPEVEVTAKLLARGRQRFEINCSPCHGSQGDGKGMAQKFGVVTVKNLHEKAIVVQTDGELFNTISYGKNTMFGYAANVTVEDRWAIVAYLRALQLSRLGTIEDVPESMRSTLKK